jgi:hypothetical protein
MILLVTYDLHNPGRDYDAAPRSCGARAPTSTHRDPCGCSTHRRSRQYGAMR